jgi:hypothetical protein
MSISTMINHIGLDPRHEQVKVEVSAYNSEIHPTVNNSRLPLRWDPPRLLRPEGKPRRIAMRRVTGGARLLTPI